MLSAALSYAARGWSVIPLRPRDKRPLLPAWSEYQNRRPVEQEIRAWWRDNPEANIGVVTGAVSGLVVLDLDGETAIVYAKEKGLPRTPTVRTNKGYHVYFTHPGGTVPNAVSLGGVRGLDLRGDRGYVAAPPSVHPSGRRYAWARGRGPDDLPLAPLPEWVLKLIQRPTETPAPRDSFWVVELLQGVPQGQRNDAATKLVGHWFGKGLPEDEVWLLLTEWNRKNSPPLPERELRAVFDSVARREARKPKRVNGEAEEEDLWSHKSLLSYPESPAPDAFYGLAGDIVQTVDPHTEADPVAVLAQTLIAFGNVIGRTAYFVAEADKHYLNEFAVLVGSSAKGRKGSSFGHVRRLFRMVDPEWEENRVQFGLSSGEGLIWAVHDPIEKEEPVYEGKGHDKRLVGRETVIVDTGVEDKRLLAYEAEFASTLRVLQREGNTLSANIRNAWDHGRLQSLTKNSPAKATDAHISIIGHITKDELLRYLDTTEAGNGFGNRFQWLCVRRSKVLPEGGNLRDEDLYPLAERLRDAVEFAKTVGEMKRDEAARRLWYEVYPELSEGKPGLLGAMIARAEAHVMRLACIYALLDLSAVIREEHLKAALALWDYCERSARFIFGDALGDPVADEILQAARRAAENGLTRTEIRDLFGRHQGGKRIASALSALAAAGLMTMRTEETGGRHAERWFATQIKTSRDCDKSDLCDKSLSPPTPSVANVANVANTSQKKTTEPPAPEPERPAEGKAVDVYQSVDDRDTALDEIYQEWKEGGGK
ncbi:uncharacterized protein DUF3987 [Thermodesulfitimonas autotrophica]|uniref:Uncharacterized protein DUF3987 n=1 Tax=Thermodesulfitimonas autotrophica TaxID=1894989 RepID=A0A3N5BTJ7_9THEO|nr:bifunctional DNA primase/polymerase [Thermodesulfitimonas autotrophica]RPF47101.1 uncharacterized protein DUF3987 [Thermodesulfitimonas autotrophica]